MAMQGRVGGTDGLLFQWNFMGMIRNSSEPAKVSLGEWYVPTFVYTDYWVVAAGKFSDLSSATSASSTTSSPADEEEYDWAIITGSLPNQETTDGKCVPTSGLKDIGFKIYSRVAEPSNATIAAIEKIADGLSLDTSKLVKVNQANCEYVRQQSFRGL